MKTDKRWKTAGIIMEWLVKSRGKDNVILAGGAIRDVLNDKPIKDFDFFVKGKQTNIEQFNMAGLTFTKASSEEYDNADFETWSSDCGNYQIMYVSKALVNVVRDDFDINICKVYYHPVRGFVKTKDYLEGIRDKKIISDGYSQHVDRVVVKFPEFRVSYADLALKPTIVPKSTLSGY